MDLLAKTSRPGLMALLRDTCLDVKRVNKVEDVVAVVNYILGEHDTKFLPEAADVNGDNKIDVDDVVAIVNKILESSQAEEITNE